ncbi:MAG: hypothetical protein ACFCGT_19715 [Sandaracinaceae bacterium]
MRTIQRGPLLGLVAASLVWLAPTAVLAQEEGGGDGRYVEDNARIRFGADGGAGALIFAGQGGARGGGHGAAQVRLGVQFSSLFGLYGQTGLLFGAWDRAGSGDPAGLNNWSSGGGFDFTFGNFFQIGAEGSFDLLSGDLFNANGYPGVGARIAFMLGTTGPGARGAFAIALKQHVTIITDAPGENIFSWTYLTVGFELF